MQANIEKMTKAQVALQKLYTWVENQAYKPHAKQLLFWNAFTESIFFPLPPDILLIALVLVQKHRWIIYTAITTVGSVLGGVVGYLIGFYVFDAIGARLIEFYGLTNSFNLVQEQYNNYAFWTVFLSGFSPIPYKIFTIAGGFFKVPLHIFLIGSIIGRGLRYIIVGFLVKRYGKLVSRTIYNHFNYAALVLTIIIVVFLILFSN
tara:strand:+ start:2444 stop:3058 length:615 start_codon:yes stop_codon:yes gene_type:complete